MFGVLNLKLTSIAIANDLKGLAPSVARNRDPVADLSFVRYDTVAKLAVKLLEY